MAFNHYAKIRRILDSQPDGWYVVRINEPTAAFSFSGKKRQFDHYYRIYGRDGGRIKYCKFQQLDRFASIMGLPVDALAVIDADEFPQH